MSLLFDENLSPRLPRLLVQLFPGAVHVRDVGMSRADDAAVWKYARAQGLTIVTKDDDFRQRSFVFGAPPKVIWLRLGNCQTEVVQALLDARAEAVHAFLADTASSVLIMRKEPRPPRE